MMTSSGAGCAAGGGNVGATAGPVFRAENWKNSGAFSGRLRCWTALPEPEPPGIVSS